VQKLLREFGSADRVTAASEEDLAKVIGRAAAKRVIGTQKPSPATD
jgi:excinuclease UvrABC nuclease subunit